MIDLHLHTTASDGRDTPEELVAQLVQTGIRVFAVTDHDTVASLTAVEALGRVRGLRCIPGIEITAVDDERDIHILAYGFDVASPALAEFLAAQRASRVDRIRAFGERFAQLGMTFEVDPLIAQAESKGGRSVGRAHVARALVAAGRVQSIEEAFDRWLTRGRPGFVPRRGASVAEVVDRVHEAAGIASLAHPALIHDDELVLRLLKSGFDAVEVFHSEHDVVATEQYRRLAADLRLAMTGGSDFHGAGANRRRPLGGVSLPADAYAGLRERAARAGCAFTWPRAD